MKTYAIVGAGGFGREVMPLAHDMLAMTSSDPDWDLVFVVDEPSVKEINGKRVVSTVDYMRTKGDRYFNIAIADSIARERIAKQFEAEGALPFTISAMNNVELWGNDVGAGAIFCPFTMITSNAQIGRYFHANIYSYVAHDCIIGDFVTFAPNVHCNGRVKIESHAYIGTGAIIKQGSDDKPIVIGRGAVVGMGAVVTKSVPAGETVVGNPARVMERQNG